MPPCSSSRPQVRKVFHRPRSVKTGLVDAGVLAVEAASRVDVGSCLLGALLKLRSESCVRARQRTCYANQHLCPGAAAEGDDGCQCDGGKKRLLHYVTPSFISGLDFEPAAIPTVVASETVPL